MNDNIIEISNLNVYYDKKKILNNINATFKKNSITAIIGASGCGKTTFLTSINKSILMNDNVNISGDIFFNGQNINDINNEKLKTHIGIVMQNAVIFPFSIYKNLSLVLDYHTSLSSKEKQEKIIDILKQVKLYDEIDKNLNKKASSLSGGQKQRLQIARSLIINPDVLLLDEPCSALDINNQNIIEDLLLELKSKMTLIIITHNIKEAKKISDEVIFIQNGEIIEKSSSLLTNPQNEATKKFLNIGD